MSRSRTASRACLVLFGILAALLPGGCATMFDRPTERIRIDSEPTAASLRITCDGGAVYEASTPAEVQIPRRDGDCLIEASKSGYVTGTAKLEQGLNPRILWNLTPLVLGAAYFFSSDMGPLEAGGVVAAAGFSIAGGFVIDRVSRRNADHDPKEVKIILTQISAPP